METTETLNVNSPRPEAPQRSATRGGALRPLLMLNGALLVILAAISFSPTTDAQARARGDYVMVAGLAPGTNNAGAVYLIDAVNQEMVVIAYNPAERRLDGIAYRNLAMDAANLLRGPQTPRR